MRTSGETTPFHTNHQVERDHMTQGNLVAEDTGERPQQTKNALKSLADWGITETGASTLGELIKEIMLSGEPQPDWEQIAGIPLSDLADPPPNVPVVLAEWASTLTEREQEVFRDRMVARNRKKTFDELSQELRVHPSTVRETQEGVRNKLLDFMKTRKGRPILRRVEGIRGTMGAAMKEDAANEALDLPETDPTRDLLLSLAGPYRRDGEWLVLERLVDTDPTEELLRAASDAGRLNERMITYRLERWGLEPGKHRDWITRDGRVREFKGRLVLWGKNLSDLAVMALDDLGAPATSQEIQEHLGEGVSPRSLHVALSRDLRLVKTGPRVWGLRSWRLPEYFGMVHQMRQVLQEQGEMPVGELFQLMSSAYGAGEETLRAAAAKQDFVTAKGRIRLRNESETTPKRPRRRLTGTGET